MVEDIENFDEEAHQTDSGFVKSLFGSKNNFLSNRKPIHATLSSRLRHDESEDEIEQGGKIIYYFFQNSFFFIYFFSSLFST